jgi:hypothetical protein
MRKTVLLRGRLICLTENYETTRIFIDEENKYLWMWKTVFVAGRVLLEREEG